MADAVDMAGQIEAEHLARGLAAVSADIPDGVAGECDECGEDMPRLVHGRCGYCRDGRKPALSRFDGPAPPWPVRVPLAAGRGNDRNPPRPSPPEPTTMTEKTPASRPITLPAPAALYDEIKRRADAGDLSMGRAALDLVERAIVGDAAPAEPAPAGTPRRQMVALLDQVSVLFLEQLDAAERAAAQPDQSDALTAALARAEAAEAKVAQMQAVLS